MEDKTKKRIEAVKKSISDGMTAANACDAAGLSQGLWYKYKRENKKGATKVVVHDGPRKYTRRVKPAGSTSDFVIITNAANAARVIESLR